MKNLIAFFYDLSGFTRSNRITRARYWNLLSFVSLAIGVALFIQIIFSLYLSPNGATVVAALCLVTVLIFAISSYIVTIKRLHDVSISGWLSLVCLIPLINFFFSIILGTIPSTEGDNQYGTAKSARVNANAILAVIWFVILIVATIVTSYVTQLRVAELKKANAASMLSQQNDYNPAYKQFMTDVPTK